MSNSQYKPPVKISVRGATAPDGKPYVRVAASRSVAWIARDAFIGSGGEALRMLKAANLPFLTHEWEQCRQKVAELEKYPSLPLIDRPGWNGSFFALADGTVYPSSTDRKPVVLFPPDSERCAAAGSIDEWCEITSLLRDQSIATFCLLIAYAGPFLALTNQVMNQGFELAGPGGVGKSTIQRMAAAVCGPADNPRGPNYWVTANMTINGAEDVMRDHNDMVLVIDEANLFAGSDHCTARAAKLNELVFKLADGTSKRRFNSAQVRRSRFTYLMSTNEPFAQLPLARSATVFDAAADRLHTIVIDPERQHGVFDSVPDGFANSGALADHLNQAIRKCYGVGIRQLLCALMIDMIERPQWVEKRLRKLMVRFRKEVGVDGNDGSKTRVADAFALIYAVGMLAIRYKAVSSQLKPLDAALACYKLNQASRAKPPAPLSRLRDLINGWDTLVISYDRLHTMNDKEIESHEAIMRTARSGRNELLLTQRQLDRLFPNSRAFFADPEIQACIVTEEGRRQTKRQIRSNKKSDRVYCFRLDNEI